MKKGFYNLLKGKFLISDDAFKNWRFIFFLSALSLIVIASSHRADKKVYRIAQLNNEVKEIKSEFADVRMIFMQAKMETKIISDMAKNGLVPSETPPQKIIITKKD